MTAPKGVALAAAAGTRGKWRTTIAMLLLTPALLALLFPPFYGYFLSPLALVPLCLCVVRRPMRWGYAGLYYLCGVVFFLPNLYWLAPVDALGFVLLALFCACYFPVFAFGLHRLVNGLRVPGMVAVPLVWTTVEYVRGTLVEGGFPWFMLGNSLAPAPLLIQVADLFGVWGVTFFIALLNGVLLDLLRLPLMKEGRFNPVLGRIIATATMLTAFVLLYGMFRLQEKTLTPGPRVAVVQENIPQTLKDNPKENEPNFQRHTDLTRRAAAENPRPALIVWPETMVPEPVNREFLAMRESALSDAGREMQKAARRCDQQLRDLATSTGASLLVGTEGLSFDELTGQPRRQNLTMMYTPEQGQLRDYYAKVHLVPFGEYIPFRGLPLVGKYMVYVSPIRDEHGAPIDFSNVPGTRWLRFQLSATQVSTVEVAAVATAGASTVAATEKIVRRTQMYTFATPICFEDTMPEPGRKMTAPQFGGTGGRGAGRKADFLVNVSNDGWFYAVELDQHLQATVLRAVENRVPIARAVNTGNSGFIDSCGRIVKLVTGPDGKSTGAVGTAAATLMLDSRVTLFSQIGDLLPILCGVAAVLGIGWTFVRPRR